MAFCMNSNKSTKEGVYMESFSTYLSQSKPLLQKLIQMLSAKYTYVSILACDSVGKFIEVSEKEQKIIEPKITEFKPKETKSSSKKDEKEEEKKDK